MIERKNKVGRPLGYRCSDETKGRISQGVKHYYANMTPQQKKIREQCNKIRSLLYHKVMDDFYNNNILNY